MRVCRCLLLLGFFCLGCQSLALPQQGEQAASPSQAREQPAIVLENKVPTLAEEEAKDYLGLAATALEQGDRAEACRHLSLYVSVHPEQINVRSHLAEMLARLDKMEEAKREFERLDADIQDQGTTAMSMRIHCQRRLLDLADAAQDEYGEHLHRGIGLFLLAQARAALPEPDGDLSTEGLLFQAAAELALARRKQPGEARPSWYLYRIWLELGQRPLAIHSLREAEMLSPFTPLVPAEQRALHLAWQRQEAEEQRK